MPTLEFKKSEIFDEKYLLKLKFEIEEEKEDKIVLSTDDILRIDLYFKKGIERAIKLLKGDKEELNIKPKEGNYKLIVTKRLFENTKRKYIVGLIAKGNVTEEFLKEIIQFQEKVVNSLGGNRRVFAIGFYEADKIDFPIYYDLADKDEKIIPLYKDEYMTLEDVLKKTKQGKKYRKLIDNYTVLRDKKEIIGFPPIINSDNVGRVKEGSKELFVDVSGINLELQKKVLDVIAYMLYLNGFEIYYLDVEYPKFKLKLPELKNKEFDKKILDKVKKISGTDKFELLERMDYKLEEKIIVPFYRIDVLDEYDIAEDLLMVYDYNAIEEELPNFFTIGELKDFSIFIRRVRELIANMGFLEVRNSIITSKELYKIFGKNIIGLKNPVSKNYDGLRNFIYPQLVFMLEKKARLPIRIFEVGKIYNKKEEIHLAMLIAKNKSNFNEMKQYLIELFHNLGIKFEIKESNYSDLIDGRQANIIVNGKIVGIIGEVNPNVLEKLNIFIPTTILELNLSAL